MIELESNNGIGLSCYLTYYRLNCLPDCRDLISGSVVPELCQHVAYHSRINAGNGDRGIAQKDCFTGAYSKLGALGYLDHDIVGLGAVFCKFNSIAYGCVKRSDVSEVVQCKIPGSVLELKNIVLCGYA